MPDKRWKQFERWAAELIGGKRFWANSGEAIDCESERFVAQCKLVKVLSLSALSKLCMVAQEQGRAKGKIGVVVTKVGHSRNPAIVSMTTEEFKTLLCDEKQAPTERPPDQIVTVCPKCHHSNPGFRPYCDRCGWESSIAEDRVREATA